MFWTLAFRRDVVIRALRTTLVVGVVLVFINHGDALLAATVDSGRLAKMLLTLAVPYCVSTWSSVGAIKTTLRSELKLNE